MAMEGLMKKQICAPNMALLSPSPTLALHKASHSISKSKPKIRIIHIFAPEIIKTDPANFRELVQRLTGKPADDHKNCRRSSRKKRLSRTMIKGGSEAELRERIKGEEEIWRGANSGGGFLGGLGDQFDGFMQELNQFPFLEDTTQIDAYGESQLT